MGSNQGVVWNDSDLPLQYCIYGAFQEIGSTKTRKAVHPRIDINMTSGSVNLDGFESLKESEANPKYAQSFVEVQPGRHSSIGLSDLKMNEHKISLRVKVGDFVKYLVKDVVIKSIRDTRLKVRYDLSIKNLGDDEAKQLIHLNEERSEIKRERQMRQEKIYAQALSQLTSRVQ